MEIWKPVQGYEGLYEISNIGRVKSLKQGKENILKPGKVKGYLYVVLCKNGKTKNFRIHRLVATAFIPNPENKPCIDHINTIRTDNRKENLCWATYKENRNNPISKKRNAEAQCKKVINITTGEVFNSINEAAQSVGVYHSHISDCCNGKQKTSGGYKWSYVD